MLAEPISSPPAATAGELPFDRLKDAAATPTKLSVGSLMMPIALLAICIYFSVVSGGLFLSPRNLSMLAIELSITAVLALGMLLVILPGHIDLSVGSGVGLIGGIAAVLTLWHGWPAILAMGAATAIALLIWWAMGAVIVLQRVPAFIITLGGLLAFRGLHWLVIKNSTVPVVEGGGNNLYSNLTTLYLPPALGLGLCGAVVAALVGVAIAGYRRQKAAGDGVSGELLAMRTFVICQSILLVVLVCNAYRGLPLPAVIFAVVATAVWFLTQQTPLGRYLYAIGGNEEAALISGIPLHAVTIAAFVMMGGLVALTGFLQTAYAGASTTTVGNLLELDAVAACVIGGASLRGGRGTVGGVVLGSLVMAALLNGMTLLAVSPEAKYIARGSVLALAVWADARMRKPN